MIIIRKCVALGALSTASAYTFPGRSRPHKIPNLVNEVKDNVVSANKGAVASAGVAAAMLLGMLGEFMIEKLIVLDNLFMLALS